MAHMEGLTFHSDSRGKELHETRAGIPHFSGSAFLLPEWRFKVLRKKAAINSIKDDGMREEKLAELTSKIVDLLDGRRAWEQAQLYETAPS